MEPKLINLVPVGLILMPLKVSSTLAEKLDAWPLIALEDDSNGYILPDVEIPA